MTDSPHKDPASPAPSDRVSLESWLRRAAMGEIRASVRLENWQDQALCKAGVIKPEAVRCREVDAVVDTGAVMSLLPQDVVEDLGLEPRGRFIVQLADDRKIELPCAGDLRLTVAGREMVTDCLVGPPGCEALVGQLVLERLDLICDPVRRTLTVRPESPFRPTLKMKAASASLREKLPA